MKSTQKLLLYAVIFIVLIAVGILSYVTLALPNVGPAENITIAPTPQRLARGEYLVKHVVLCIDCHSRRNWSKFAAPYLTAGIGGGGEVFDSHVGFPGEVHVPNITPYALKDWTDGELYRAITTGERKNGTAIFPLMPWPYYAKMSREDIYATIAYIRTLKPVVDSYPKARLNFPLNILVHTMPAKASPGTEPATADSVKYGEYIATGAGCMECHSKQSNGKVIGGTAFGGGHEYVVNNVMLRSANITPDKKTGIGNWSEADFVQAFKAFSDTTKAMSVARGNFQTIMPWYAYAGMTDGDLKSIYLYLRTMKPIKNNVIKFKLFEKQ
jgi:mono/diheme cytochrome c family protein